MATTSTCRDEIRGLLALRDEDALGPAEARRLREHLASCAACRETALAHDPTLIFSALAGDEALPRRARSADAEAERLVADVLAAVEVERSRRRLEGGRRPGLLAFLHGRPALKAASIALLGGILGALYLSLKPQESGPIAALFGKSTPPAVAQSLTPRQDVRPAGPTSFTAPATRLDKPGYPFGVPLAPPVLEDLENPGATVYEFASRSPQEPTVVFVVDRNADL